MARRNSNLGDGIANGLCGRRTVRRLKLGLLGSQAMAFFLWRKLSGLGCGDFVKGKKTVAVFEMILKSCPSIVLPQVYF